MSIETLVYGAIKNLVSGRVYRDHAPRTGAITPYITFQQVGGKPINFFDDTVPAITNGRVQFNAWHDDYDSAMALIKQVADAIKATATLHSSQLGGPVALYEAGAAIDTSDLYGAMQDFSLWA